MKRLLAFFRNRAGLAAVEFALVAPMMVFLLFGSIELVNVLQTSRRVQNVASSLSDVIARGTTFSTADRDGLWQALNPLMFPDPDTGLDIRITSIRIVSATNARVEWCVLRGSHFSQLREDDPVTSLSSGMMTPSSTVIRVETRYSYTPLLGFWMIDGNRSTRREEGDITLSHTAYSRSRLVDVLPCTNCPSS